MPSAGAPGISRVSESECRPCAQWANPLPAEKSESPAAQCTDLTVEQKHYVDTFEPWAEASLVLCDATSHVAVSDLYQHYKQYTSKTLHYLHKVPANQRIFSKLLKAYLSDEVAACRAQVKQTKRVSSDGIVECPMVWFGISLADSVYI